MALSLSVFVSWVAAQNANAATIAVVTDQVSQEKARELVQLMKSTPPFSRMTDLNLVIHAVQPDELGCGAKDRSRLSAFSVLAQTLGDPRKLLPLLESNQRLVSWNRPLPEMTPSAQPNSKASTNFASGGLPASCRVPNAQLNALEDRLIRCDSPESLAFLRKQKTQLSASYVMVVIDDPRYGGSGGEFPTMTSASPTEMGIHELMHQLGFTDEYQYISACEADIYCLGLFADFKSPSGFGSYPGTAFNVAVFTAQNPYASSQDVITRHGKKIPWLKQLPAAALATLVDQEKNLGTPDKNTVGIFSTNVCDLASTATHTWTAETRPTIMQTLNTNYIPSVYWPTIAKSLGTTVGAAVDGEAVY